MMEKKFSEKVKNIFLGKFSGKLLLYLFSDCYLFYLVFLISLIGLEEIVKFENTIPF